MGAISDRLSDIARRGGNLAPLAEPVRQVLIQGNRERALAGTDAQGNPFAPLKPSTLKGRKGTGPPGAPRGASSRIVTGYVASVIAAVGRLTFTGSWPGLDWVRFHADGTNRMARRDPYGFRAQDLAKCRQLLVDFIMRQGR